jgi:hypothetical protein
VEVAAKETETFPALSEVNDPRLLPVQPQPKISQNLPGQLLGRTGLHLAATHHDEIVRITNEPAVDTLGEREVQRMQVDVRQKQRDHAALRGPSD